jgi:hypothetical protein
MSPWFRPTLDTKFHIDFDWWEQSGRNFRVYLYSQLCEECRSRFPSHYGTEEVDWVNPETGEVRRTDALWECLRNRCINERDFISESVPLTAAAFRAFLANNNEPMTPVELHDWLKWQTPEAILRVLSARQVYMGIRPIFEN